MANVKGTNGDDVLDLADGVTEGFDSVYGYAGNDTLKGFGGDDHLFGGEGQDQLYGGNGNDLLKGGAGADHLVGGAGIDTASYAESTEGVMVYLAAGNAFRGEAEGDTFVVIENVFGSSFDDYLYGDDGGNELSGGAGMDNLGGGGGADTLYGGADNDFLTGGAGADRIDGGAGFDSASYFGGSEGVTVSLLTGTGSGGHAEGDQLISIERLEGTAHYDTLIGDDGANMLSGHGGNDDIKGFGGDDSIWGYDENDNLYGMEGDDVIRGGDGDDAISGGLGRDSHTGNGGADTFVWASAAEADFVTDVNGTNLCSLDAIVDFSRPQGDLIDVSAIDADVDVAGNQAFTFIGTAADFTAAGQIKVNTDGVDTYLVFNVDADLDYEAAIRVAGLQTVQANWFDL
jgi:Ca2+-binding RTX toxin-like protein